MLNICQYVYIGDKNRSVPCAHCTKDSKILHSNHQWNNPEMRSLLDDYGRKRQHLSAEEQNCCGQYKASARRLQISTIHDTGLAFSLLLKNYKWLPMISVLMGPVAVSCPDCVSHYQHYKTLFNIRLTSFLIWNKSNGQYVSPVCPAWKVSKCSLVTAN